MHALCMHACAVCVSVGLGAVVAWGLSSDAALGRSRGLSQHPLWACPASRGCAGVRPSAAGPSCWRCADTGRPHNGVLADSGRAMNTPVATTAAGHRPGTPFVPTTDSGRACQRFLDPFSNLLAYSWHKDGREVAPQPYRQCRPPYVCMCDHMAVSMGARAGACARC